jgi:hypothetical protein
VCFDLVSSAAGLAIYHYSGFSNGYLRFFFFGLAVDFLLYLCVLAELGKNVLHYNRETFSRLIVFLFFLWAAVCIGSFSSWALVPSRSLLSSIYFLAMRAAEILQFAGFLALITWSSLCKFRWPDRELHIATGFAFDALVWLVVCLLHAQWRAGPAYHRVDQAGAAVDLLVLAYWLHYFWIGAGGKAAVQDAVAGSGNDRDRRNPGRTKRFGIAEGGCRAARNEDPE